MDAVSGSSRSIVATESSRTRRFRLTTTISGERRNRRIRLIVGIDELDVIGPAIQHRLNDREGVDSATNEHRQLPASISGHYVGRHIGLAQIDSKKRATFQWPLGQVTAGQKWRDGLTDAEMSHMSRPVSKFAPSALRANTESMCRN
jgi:hypothetical protein